MAEKGMDETTIISENTASKRPPKIGKYAILKELGRGGMGMVYLGKDPVLDRLAAIKTLLPFSSGMSQEAKKQLLERFMREAKAIAQLNHQNIINIYSIGRHDKTLYIAMEYVEGCTFADIIKSGKPYSFKQKINFMVQMCAGLQVIHEAGLVHRDIKPGNIMITADDLIKIMDFGTVHIKNSELTRTEQIIGTPSYMSPEQVQGIAGDSRSDIFALGSLFYQLLTGEKPFQGDSFSAVAYQIMHSDPPPPSKLNTLLPEHVDDVILKALAKSPEERYESCNHLAEHLYHCQEMVEAGLTKAKTRKTTTKLLIWILSLVLLIACATGAFVYHAGGMEQAVEQMEEWFTNKPSPLSFSLNYAYRPENTEEPRRLRHQDKLASSDTYKIFFTPDETCYVYIFRVDKEINVTQLFPVRGQEANQNPVQPKHRYLLPSKDSPYVYDGIGGVNHIYFLASRERKNKLEKFVNLLETSKLQKNDKLIKFYRFKLRMMLKKSVIQTSPTEYAKEVVWGKNNKKYSFNDRRLEELCHDCLHVLEFSQ